LENLQRAGGFFWCSFYVFLFNKKFLQVFLIKIAQVRIEFSLNPRHYFDDVRKAKASIQAKNFAENGLDTVHLVLICLRVHTIFSLQNGSLPELCCSLSQLKEMKKNFALPKNLLDRG
jgi:hypothetical protein